VILIQAERCPRLSPLTHKRTGDLLSFLFVDKRVTLYQRFPESGISEGDRHERAIALLSELGVVFVLACRVEILRRSIRIAFGYRLQPLQ
jgi:hypothetical protein